MAKFQTEPAYSSQFIKALNIVGEWHKYQVRKQGSVPYIAHLLGTASIVLEAGGCEEEAVAALCHDVVEDIGIPIDEIGYHFGHRVQEIVAALTEDKSLPKAERKQAYIQNIASGDMSVKLVSAADKLYNIETYCTNPELFNDEVAWFYLQLLPIYQSSLKRNVPFHNNGRHFILYRMEQCLNTLFDLQRASKAD